MSVPQLALSIAQDMCEDWRDKSESDKGSAIDGIKAFLIPHNAVAELISDNVHAIRVYLAWDSTNSEVKLVVVGTEDDNGVERDIIESDPNTKIYDFTLACPTTCDTQSALN